MAEPLDHEDDWTAYKATGDLEARERLIIAYTPLVRYVASKVGSGLPQNVEQKDLASYGTFGLIDAIDKFDVGLGYKFETYAISRIRGAIIDELRTIDWVPRSIRSKQRSMEAATRKLESRLHRSPTEQELADELEQTVEQLRSARTQIGNTFVSTFDESPPGEDNQSTAETLSDAVDLSGDYTSSAAIDDMRDVLAAAAESIPEREQLVLALYYHEGLTLSEVGQVLGVTESRICQIHTKAVLQLRAHITPSDLEPA